MATPVSVPQNFSTTLNVGGGINNSQTTGIVLTSITGLPTDGGILAFDWASTIDTSVIEYIEYTGISGNELTGVTRGSEGYSAKSHSNGCVIAGVFSKAHINRLRDKLTGNDTVLAQDPNGNEILKTTYVASAVNEVTVTNAATGNPPIIAATGGDSAVALRVRGKSASVASDGMYDNGNSGTSKAINWANGDVQKVTLTGNCTFTYSGAVTGQRLTLLLIEDATGSRTITLPTSKYPNGTTPTFTTTANAINAIVVLYDGTNYLTQSAVGFA